MQKDNGTRTSLQLGGNVDCTGKGLVGSPPCPSLADIIRGRRDAAQKRCCLAAISTTTMTMGSSSPLISIVSISLVSFCRTLAIRKLLVGAHCPCRAWGSPIAVPPLLYLNFASSSSSSLHLIVCYSSSLAYLSSSHSTP